LHGELRDRADPSRTRPGCSRLQEAEGEFETAGIYDWDWPAAEREGRRALAREPRNSFVIGNVGFARSAFAEPEESARPFLRKMKLL